MTPSRFGKSPSKIPSDPAKARRTQVIEGKWVFKERGAQFRSGIKFEGGETLFEADNLTFRGGGRTLPGPMHYSLYGLASCYTGVFEAMAAMQGTQLKKLTARVETDINFSKVFGVGDQPIMEEVRVMLRVVSDAPEEMIRKAVALALQRCPVVFTLRNPIRLRTRLEILREA